MLLKCFLDTETCGLHGPIVCIQYAIEPEYEIKVHHVWYEPVYKTLGLLLELMKHRIIAYNLAFDWFHINKLYNMLRLVWDKTIYPIDSIELMIELEELGRDGLCLKPQSCLDLMLFARKGPYQSAMGIKPVIIRRVPEQSAQILLDKLESSFEFDDVYFAGYKKARKHKWDMERSENVTGFYDLRLIFNPRTDLKTMAEHVLKRKRSKFTDIMPTVMPVELGYAPYAKAIIALKSWPTAKAPTLFGTKYNGAWPLIIEQHAEHWKYMPNAIYYSEMDVQDLIDLYKAFDEPEFDDDDSTLAAMAGAVRWKGFAIDQDKMQTMSKAMDKLVDYSIPFRASKACYEYLHRHMNEEQQITWDGKTAGKQLEAMVNWDGKIGPAAEKVLRSRQWNYLVKLFDKFAVTDRFHASVKVIGAKSTRMSGADGINAQGIPRVDSMRACFPFAFLEEDLWGGDFKAFEVGIFLASCEEGKLLDEVKAGKKIHALYGIQMYPELTYDEIIATEGTEDDKYGRSKSGLFLNMYGGTAYSMEKQLGIPADRADAGIKGFAATYPEVGKAQRKAVAPYEALVQGENRRIEWSEPLGYIESLLGFRRYFDIEISIMKTLFEIAEHIETLDLPDGRVYRRKDGSPQTIEGATRSALFGAAFSTQGSIQRIAGNHRIQSTGAGILKQTQRRVWDIQPAGIGRWQVRTLNIHDELVAVIDPALEVEVAQAVNETVDRLKSVVPLLAIEWAKGDSWAQVH